MKKQTLNEQVSRMKQMMGILNEQPFNDDGEPLMTYQQYRDYSEPSEPDYDDMNDRPSKDSPVNWLRENLKDNDMFLANYGSNHEYSLTVTGNYDFSIYFDSPGDMESPVSIHIYDGDTNEVVEQRFVDVIEAFNFILSVKDKYQFQSYESAVRDYEKSQRDDARDRYNNRMERGGFD